MESTLVRLCIWYQQQCVNDWQEAYGVKIDTLDNPGWCLSIDLVDTKLQNRSFSPVKVNRSEVDWYVARREHLSFEAYGGPGNLEEMINCFLLWAEDSVEEPERNTGSVPNDE